MLPRLGLWWTDNSITKDYFCRTLLIEQPYCIRTCRSLALRMGELLGSQMGQDPLPRIMRYSFPTFVPIFDSTIRHKLPYSLASFAHRKGFKRTCFLAVLQHD